MYCYHCGYEIDESKLEKKSSSFEKFQDKVDDKTKVSYVCPRCGHLITPDANDEDVKSLSRAAHAQMQRARNSFATGMGNISIGVIALIIAILFFFLAKKPSNGYVLVTTCAEFYVFLVLAIISVILLVAGAIFVSIGLAKKRHYHALLQDINNKTFVQ
jgi:prepilin signal peptidase PulO-like enzyme (type II secretory pathway)